MFGSQVENIQGVFGPADPAFAELGDAKFQELAGNPVALTPILQHHVVSKRYDAKGLEAAKTVKTLAGRDLAIAGSGDSLTMNGAPSCAATSRPRTPPCS